MIKYKDLDRMIEEAKASIEASKNSATTDDKSPAKKSDSSELKSKRVIARLLGKQPYFIAANR